MTEISITRRLKAGTRPSTLAQRQTAQMVDQLLTAWPLAGCETVLIATTGDRNLSQPLPEIGGKGVFTEQIEDALRSGGIDFAIHSLKDLPIDVAGGLIIAAIGVREDARDVLISARGWTLATLPRNARIGTSSLRRAAQLKATRPDLLIEPLRGNVDTRLRKAMLGDFDAIVLAAAGLARLGLSSHATEYLPIDVMLPAPGQGALAVQCRAGDTEMRRLLFALDDPITRATVTAERAFLEHLGGGCAAPVAAYAQHLPATAGESNRLVMSGLVATPDGARVIRVSGEGVVPNELGRQLAMQALDQGAGALL